MPLEELLRVLAVEPVTESKRTQVFLSQPEIIPGLPGTRAIMFPSDQRFVLHWGQCHALHRRAEDRNHTLNWELAAIIGMCLSPRCTVSCLAVN